MTFVRAEFAATVIVCLVAVAIELRTGEIPNWLTGPTFLAGLIIGGLDHRIADHWVAAIIAIVPTLYVYRTDWIGGGGVKLICAASALMGIHGAVVIVGVWAIVTILVYSYTRIREREASLPVSPLVLGGVLVAIALAVAHVQFGHGVAV